QAEQAMRLYQSLLVQSPDNERYQLELARSFMRVGRHRQAISAFRKLFDKELVSHEAIRLAGLCYIETGQFAEAIAVFAKLSSLDAHTAKYLGYALLETGQNVQAVEVLERACIEREDNEATLYYC